MNIKIKKIFIISIFILFLAGCEKSITLNFKENSYFIPYYETKSEFESCACKIKDGMIVENDKGIFYKNSKILFDIDFSLFDKKISIGKNFSDIKYDIYNLVNKTAIILFKYELENGYEGYYKIFAYNYENKKIENIIESSNISPIIINSMIYYYVKDSNNDYYNLYNEDMSTLIFKELKLNTNNYISNSKNMIIVKNIKNEYGIIDLKGNILVPFNSNEIINVDLLKLYISKENSNYSLYDFDNNLLLSDFQNLIFTDNYVIGTKEGKLLLYSKKLHLMHESVIENEVFELSVFDYNQYVEISYQTEQDSLRFNNIIKINTLESKIIPNDYHFINYSDNNVTIPYYLQLNNNHYTIYNSNLKKEMILEEIEDNYQYIDNYKALDGKNICIKFSTLNDNYKEKYVKINFENNTYNIVSKSECINKEDDVQFISNNNYKLLKKEKEISSNDYTIFNKINDKYYFGLLTNDFETYVVYEVVDK